MKRFLWLLLTLAVVVGAFLLPERWLISEQNRRADGSYTSDVSQNWEGSGANLTMGEKLAMLQTVEDPAQYEFGLVTQDDAIRKSYADELRMMHDMKLVSTQIYEMLSVNECEITKVIQLDIERGESLSMYRVQYYDGGTYVILDAQSSKILKIVISAFTDYFIEGETILAYEAYGGLSAPDWAAYYGGERTETVGIDGFHFRATDDYYLYAMCFTLDGQEVGFTAYYSSVMQTITYRPSSPDNVRWLATGQWPEGAGEESG